MKLFLFCIIITSFLACKKNTIPNQTVTPSTFNQTEITIDGKGNNFNNISLNPTIKIVFSTTINSANIASSVLFNEASGLAVNFSTLIENGNTLVINPNQNLKGLLSYQIVINKNLLASNGAKLQNTVNISFNTGVDNVDKFAQISDDELLTLVQKQTFKYFWDFAHPTSGMARERNTSNDVVTTGGTGFGVMATVVAINRNFIGKSEGLTRIQKIVSFLKTADRFHGVFPHWLNGNTGRVQPFSAKDDGADLVETSFLMEGLLVARQYFNSSDQSEIQLRADINQLFNAVEWDWFRKNNENQLYWHWSPNYNFDINMQVKGWNEALMVYVLAASSTTHTIPKSVYDNGWASNGGIKNGNTYNGVILPLGPSGGGPLFFEHYSLMALNPMGLTDAYANYENQAKAHSKINYNYSVANPFNYIGYSANCWGLTASDINGGYTASSPTNDKGYIAPTAAVSSLPFTPEESLRAIRFFYFKLGDKLWGDYGFKDSFSLSDSWFASSYLAIDQGPQIVMIENYRSGLIWNLFMSCPEVKSGLIKLGFQSPKI